METIDRSFSHWQQILGDLVRIPGVSASNKAEVMRSAHATAGMLRAHGVGDVQLLEDSVYGEVRVDGAAATILVYGHHDVQPPGAVDRWTTPPFEPNVRNGRMF